jgi:transposase
MKRDINVIGIDIAKRVFHAIGMDTRGTMILRKRLYRGEVMSLMAQLPRATVGMEACGRAHYWARQLRQQGHEVKLMAESMEMLGIRPPLPAPRPPAQGPSA